MVVQDVVSAGKVVIDGCTSTSAGCFEIRRVAWRDLVSRGMGVGEGSLQHRKYDKIANKIYKADTHFSHIFSNVHTFIGCSVVKMTPKVERTLEDNPT